MNLARWLADTVNRWLIKTRQNLTYENSFPLGSVTHSACYLGHITEFYL